MAKTIFQTAEGTFVSRTYLDPIVSADYAMKKAARMGVTTLYAVDESGKVLMNYSQVLRKHYLQKATV